MIVEESLSYFTNPLNIKPAISDELESVAKIGLSREGFAEVARCKVEAKRFIDKKSSSKYCITTIAYRLCSIFYL